MRPLFLFTLIAILTGCATSNISESYTFSNSSDKGLVIFSFTQSDYFAQTKVVIDANKKTAKTIEIFEDPFLFGPVGYKSELPNLIGRMIVIELEPGIHTLHGWSMTSGNFIYSTLNGFPIIPFQIKPKKAVYLGNFHMDLLLGENLLGMKLGVGGNMIISNQLDRDMEFLMKKFPNIQREQVEKYVPFSGPWIDFPDSLSSETP